MSFQLMDLEKWNRKEHYNHYLTQIPCRFGITVNLDITELLQKGKARNMKLYPMMIHGIATVVNAHEEFRMAADQEGRLGFYDRLNPSYTIFHKETETFSSIWTAYDESLSVFYQHYLEDIACYGSNTALEAKPHAEVNVFPLSCLPWTSFTGFTLHLQKGFYYLPPVFTMGKYYEAEGKTFLPLAVEAHHAVCDGFHVSRLLNEIQARFHEKI